MVKIVIIITGIAENRDTETTIRSIWYWDELIELYEEFFQQRIKNQGFYRQSKKLWYVP